ncbi:MAG: hypothetical protein ACI36W_06250 [Coriobacteriales bacterium]
MFDRRSVTVLTTPEEADYYKSVLGDDADYRFELTETEPLKDFLANLAIGRGTIVVIDENHCLSSNAMVAGLHSFLNEPAWGRRGLRIIVSCPRRKAGDPLLRYLATYCGIYDIIYDGKGPHISSELSRLLERPNVRCDVLDLLGEPLADIKLLESAQGVSVASIETSLNEEIRINISFERVKKSCN